MLLNRLRAAWLTRQYDDELIPPQERIFIGHTDPRLFKLIGLVFAKKFIVLCGLRPDAKVLEVGSGIGRMAIPLAPYLKRGSYEGFDIVPHGVAWCRDKISARYPNFNFQVADIYNKNYNPGGGCRAEDYRFPYPSAHFDFVLLTSVFTHMLPAEVENYLSEIKRVLKPGGTCLSTFFIFDGHTLECMARGLSKHDFKHDFGHYRVVDQNVPEAAVAYADAYVRSIYAARGMNITHFERGMWHEHKTHAPGLGQDIVVASA